MSILQIFDLLHFFDESTETNSTHTFEKKVLIIIIVLILIKKNYKAIFFATVLLKKFLTIKKYVKLNFYF